MREIVEQEERNYRASEERLGPELAFLQRLRELYESPRQAIPEDRIATSLLFSDSDRSLIISAIAVMRGHQSEAMASLRRAIEAVAYAHRAKDLKDARIWLKQKSKEPEFWRQFQKGRFKTKIPEMPELEHRWEMACEAGSHATFLSLAARTKMNEGKYNFSYFDIDDDPEVNVQRTLNFIIHTHELILSAFHRLLDQNLGEEWLARFTKFRSEREAYALQVLRPIFEESHAQPPEIEERTLGGIIIPKPNDIAKLVFKSPRNLLFEIGRDAAKRRNNERRKPR